MRQVRNTDTHALNHWGRPKIVPHSDPISLLISTFGIHLQPGYKSHSQVNHYRLLKSSKNKRHFSLSIFRRKLITWPGRYFLYSDLLARAIWLVTFNTCLLFSKSEISHLHFVSLSALMLFSAESVGTFLRSTSRIALIAVACCTAQCSWYQCRDVLWMNSCFQSVTNPPPPTPTSVTACDCWRTIEYRRSTIISEMAILT